MLSSTILHIWWRYCTCKTYKRHQARYRCKSSDSMIPLEWHILWEKPLKFYYTVKYAIAAPRSTLHIKTVTLQTVSLSTVSGRERVCVCELRPHSTFWCSNLNINVHIVNIALICFYIVLKDTFRLSPHSLSLYYFLAHTFCLSACAVWYWFVVFYSD